MYVPVLFQSARRRTNARLLVDFVRTGNYDLLAGVLLAVTGCEALFAK